MRRLGAAPVDMIAPAAIAAGIERDTPVTAAQPVRKTLGGKVLSAMALERATGRKPDPARLVELD
jgi:hypothetical protein